MRCESCQPLPRSGRGLQARLFASLGDADGDADGVLGASVAFSDPPRIAGLMVWDTAIVRTRFGRFVCGPSLPLRVRARPLRRRCGVARCGVVHRGAARRGVARRSALVRVAGSGVCGCAGARVGGHVARDGRVAWTRSVGPYVATPAQRRVAMRANVATRYNATRRTGPNGTCAVNLGSSTPLTAHCRGRRAFTAQCRGSEEERGAVG